LVELKSILVLFSSSGHI